MRYDSRVTYVFTREGNSSEMMRTCGQNRGRDDKTVIVERNSGQFYSHDRGVGRTELRWRGVMERLKPPVGNMTLGNGNEGAIATKNDCDVGDGLLLLST